MNISFFNGVTGLIAYQQDMDVLAHNMANVNTDGYKVTRTSFKDLLYTEMDTNGEAVHLTGHGVKAASVDLLYGQGPMRQTNNQLDLAIVGEGLFAVEKNGETQYTRCGAFGISVEGKRAYLVTKDGGYVLDAKGKEITLTKKDGSDMYDLTGLNEKVGIYQFENPYGLQQTDGSCFLATDSSGKAYTLKANQAADLPYQVIQSALESSNVQLTDEMVNLIVTQKAYQINAKMVQTADQIEEIVNNLR